MGDCVSGVVGVVLLEIEAGEVGKKLKLPRFFSSDKRMGGSSISAAVGLIVGVEVTELFCVELADVGGATGSGGGGGGGQTGRVDPKLAGNEPLRFIGMEPGAGVAAAAAG